MLFIVSVVLFQMYYEGGFMGYINLKDTNGNITWLSIRPKVPFFLFGIVFIVTTVLTFLKNFSIIPVLGFLCCSYLLSESGETNWLRFMIWLLVGMILYFAYGYKNSKIRMRIENEAKQNV